MELDEPQAGAPAAYLKELYRKALTVLKMAGSGGEKYPEVQIERVWDDIVKKLQQKEYTFDAAVYGSTDEFVKKIAYFYHASIQGAGAYPGAADALRLTAERGVVQGLLADGQCFTTGSAAALPAAAGSRASNWTQSSP